LLCIRNCASSFIYNSWFVTEWIPFRNLYIMYFILKTKYTLSLKFVPAQVRGNNQWSTSRVRLKKLNYRTQKMAFLNSYYASWMKAIIWSSIEQNSCQVDLYIVIGYDVVDKCPTVAAWEYIIQFIFHSENGNKDLLREMKLYKRQPNNCSWRLNRRCGRNY
jgi:hypothetical protein